MKRCLIDFFPTKETNFRVIHASVPIINGRLDLDTAITGISYFSLIAGRKLVNDSTIILTIPDYNRLPYPSFFEPGDTINITFNDSDVTFTGPQAAKFNCLQKMGLLHKNIKKPSNENITEWMEYYQSLEDSDRQVLNSYKDSMTEVAFSLIGADIYASRASNQFALLKKIKSRDSARKMYQRYLETEPVMLNSKNIYSVSLRRLLIKKASFIEGLSEKRYRGENLSVYNYLSSKYTGVIKEILLWHYLEDILREKTPSNLLDTMVMEYIHAFRGTDYASRIEERYRIAKNTLTTGLSAMDFSFQDSIGKEISLSALRGKVVVLDFWFTGCKFCMYLKPVIEKVQAYFRNNPSVVFVSINTDYDANQWKSSVRSGKYTSSGSINLYTSGKGNDVPFIQYYNIQAYPRLMVIDKNGRMFNSYVSPEDQASPSKLIEIILKAIGV